MKRIKEMPTVKYGGDSISNVKLVKVESKMNGTIYLTILEKKSPQGIWDRVKGYLLVG